MTLKVGIVMPTYNERENLPEMVQCLEALRRRVSWHLLLCVVDDNSPDGTGMLADALATTRPWLSVLHRPTKQGVASAYWDGFTCLLAQGAERFIQMDADFSHDPDTLDPLVQASRDSDIVIASRYVRGGRTEGWSRRRWLLSTAGNAFARLLIGVPFRDFTAGYKIYRRPVVEHLLRERARFQVQGFAFQMSTLYWAWHQGYRIREIPTVFRERRAGRSKLDQRIFWEALYTVVELRLSH